MLTSQDCDRDKRNGGGGRRRSTVELVAFCGIFTALAMIFSYIEMLLPISIGIPGIKLGLANSCAIVVLYVAGAGTAVLVNLARIALSGLLFGNFVSFLFSVAGGVTSMLLMIALMKSRKFSCVVVSIAGGVMHNIAQIVAAVLIMENAAISYYLPVLILSGIITGALIGIIAGLVIARIPRPL